MNSPRNHEVTVSPYGFPMSCVVEFDSGEAQTFDHPGSGAYCVLIKCVVGGVDITEMLDNATTDRIEDCAKLALLEGVAA